MAIPNWLTAARTARDERDAQVEAVRIAREREDLIRSRQKLEEAMRHLFGDLWEEMYDNGVAVGANGQFIIEIDGYRWWIGTEKNGEYNLPSEILRVGKHCKSCGFTEYQDVRWNDTLASVADKIDTINSATRATHSQLLDDGMVGWCNWNMILERREVDA